LPSGLSTPWPEDNVVPFLYFPPPGPRPAPAVVILHGYGLGKELFAPIGPHLRRAGYAGLIPDLPFHGERAVRGSARILPFGGDLGLYVACVRQMIADCALCLSWLRRRREVDSGRLGVIGFSLGGVLVSVLMGLDLGLGAGVSLMAAGDWADLLFLTTLAADARAELERAGITVGEARLAFRDVTASTHADAVRGLLIVGGRRDDHVPSRVIETFWDKIDHASNRLTWKDSGHIPPIRTTAREVLTFLREKLGPATLVKEASPRRDERLPGYHGGGAGFPLPPLP